MRKFYSIVLLFVILIFSGCSNRGVVISEGTSTFGAVDIWDTAGTVLISGNPSALKYNMVLTNSEYYDIKVVSITPILSNTYASKVLSKDITVNVDKTISKGDSIDISV